MMRSFKTNAVELGKLPKQNPIRVIQEPALIRRVTEYGIVNKTTDSPVTLDDVLSISIEDILKRRLGSVVWLTSLDERPARPRLKMLMKSDDELSFHFVCYLMCMCA